MRVLTGTAPLDTLTRGGIPLGKRVVVGGAPGAGKTTLVVQWARELAEQGVHVCILATDEGADAIAIRLGQHTGLNRTLLEHGDPSTLARVSIPASLSLVEDLSIEAAARTLPTSGKRALIVDSLQTARSDACTGKGVRAQIEANVRALKSLARQGVLVIATSELRRQGYQGRKAPTQGDYKGSGGIEYDVDLGLALVTPDKGATVQVSVVKSRVGNAGPTDWTMRADRARAASWLASGASFVSGHTASRARPDCHPRPRTSRPRPLDPGFGRLALAPLGFGHAGLSARF